MGCLSQFIVEHDAAVASWADRPRATLSGDEGAV